MNSRVQSIVEASRDLTPLEKLELIQEISRNLHEVYAVEAASTEFWTSHSLADIGRAQLAPVVTDIHSLVADFWPSQESADEINEFIARTRLTDRNGHVGALSVLNSERAVAKSHRRTPGSPPRPGVTPCPS
ncbi:MAG: hypothetical protein U0822_19155 [Anaerolineae bacterium]